MLLTCRFSWWLASNLPRFVRLVRQQLAVTPKINQKVHDAAVLPCRCAHATVTGGFFNHILSTDKTKRLVGWSSQTYLWQSYLSNTSLPLATKRPNSPWSITCFCHVTARKKAQLNSYATGSEIRAQLPKTTLTLIQCVTLIITCVTYMYIILST